MRLQRSITWIPGLSHLLDRGRKLLRRLVSGGRFPVTARELELWADSFHEGQWACRNIARRFVELGGTHTQHFELGFQPVHTYEFGGRRILVRVFGSYRSWSDLPQRIADLLDWGKPDFLLYDPVEDRILLAVEETAAVPTGNQALQRCERQYGAARAGIPFWYLLPEYGQHIDGGVRRSSIWPSVMAMKLTLAKKLPSVVLHYSDSDSPEDYESGQGLRLLFELLAASTRNLAVGRQLLADCEPHLRGQFADMLRFVGEQWMQITDYFPGVEALANPTVLNTLVACAENRQADDAPLGFLKWPQVAGLPPEIRAMQKSQPLLSAHPFAERLEAALDSGVAWSVSKGVGSRPQPDTEVRTWLSRQRRALEGCRTLTVPAIYDRCMEDLLRSDAGRYHLTTARNILYLFDSWQEVRQRMEASWPRLAGRIPNVQDDRAVMVYVCNSALPGRIFGDPFTGQLAAFATVFGGVGERLVLAWFPYQSHPQALTTGRPPKGLLLMRELTDWMLFAGGVLIRPATGEVV